MPSQPSALPPPPRDLPAGRGAALLLVAALGAVAALLWVWWPGGVALGVVVGALAVLAIGRSMEREAAAEPVDEELVARLGVAPAPAADPDLVRAVGLVVSTQYASAARLQRDLRVPYARARALLAELEHEHVVGPPSGTRPRRVLVPHDRLAEAQRRMAR